MSKKKSTGVVIPQQVAYSLIVVLVLGAFASYNQLQSVDRRLQTIEAEINLLTSEGR